MREALILFFGMLIGGSFGVVVMCLLQLGAAGREPEAVHEAERGSKNARH